jgi:GH24 family phage-related lysozyme (muramidase)
MLHAVEQVDSCAPNAPVNVLAAFGDAVYNIGPRIACDTTASTAARKLQGQDWEGACRELPKWDKARIGGVLVPLPGLTKRRAKEMALCLSS